MEVPSVEKQQFVYTASEAQVFRGHLSCGKWETISPESKGWIPLDEWRDERNHRWTGASMNYVNFPSEQKTVLFLGSELALHCFHITEETFLPELPNPHGEQVTAGIHLQGKIFAQAGNTCYFLNLDKVSVGWEEIYTTADKNARFAFAPLGIAVFYEKGRGEEGTLQLLSYEGKEEKTIKLGQAEHWDWPVWIGDEIFFHPVGQQNYDYSVNVATGKVTKICNVPRTTALFCGNFTGDNVPYRFITDKKDGFRLLHLQDRRPVVNEEGGEGGEWKNRNFTFANTAETYNALIL